MPQPLPNFSTPPRARTIARRLPAHILVSLLIVLVTAGVLVAARRDEPAPIPVSDGEVATEPTPTPLPTPVPPSGTPLATPVASTVGVASIVDTAVTFFGQDWLPLDLSQPIGQALIRAGGTTAMGWTPAPRPTPQPATAQPAPPVTPAPVIVLPPPPVITAPPLPVPVPTLPPVPVATLPPVPVPTLPPAPLPTILP